MEEPMGIGFGQNADFLVEFTAKSEKCTDNSEQISGKVTKLKARHHA